METIIIWFFAGNGGIVETKELFPRAYFTHKPNSIFAPVQGLLEYSRTLGFRLILIQ